MNENQNSSQSDKPETNSSDPSSPVKNSSSASRKSQRKITRSTKSEVVSARKKTNPMVWLLLLVNTLVLISLSGAAAYAWLQWQGLSTAQSEREVEFKQEIQTSVAQQISNADTTAAKMLSEFETKIGADINNNKTLSDTKLAELAQQVRDLQGNTSTDWDSAELSYLLKMAQYKTLIENNIPAAILALTQANTLLEEKGDLQYLSLREAIAVDLQLLRVQNTSNQLTMLVTTTSLITSSQNLSFPEPRDFYNQEQKVVSDDISDGWENLMISLGNFFKIDWDFNLEESITPYISKQQQDLVRAALQYHLLTARHALIKQESTLYLESLDAALALLSHFENNGAEFRLFEQTLQELKNTDFPGKVELELSSYRYFIDKQETDVTDSDETQSGDQELD